MIYLQDKHNIATLEGLPELRVCSARQGPASTMVSARVCTKIGPGWIGNLDVLPSVLSLSLSLYTVQTLYLQYMYIYIVYIDNMTYVCISYPLFEIDTGKALHDGYSSILFRTEWLFD